MIAGLRAMTAPAAVSCAAHLGTLKLGGTWLALVGHEWTPGAFTVAALQRTVGIHPTVSELMPTLVGEATPAT